VDRHPELALPGGIDLDLHPYLEISQRSAVDITFDILKAYPPRSVTYIALGPLTNLALMMRKDSQLVMDRIGRIVCMGGALDVPGNTSPVAECMERVFLLIHSKLTKNSKSTSLQIPTP